MLLHLTRAGVFLAVFAVVSLLCGWGFCSLSGELWSLPIAVALGTFFCIGTDLCLFER